MNYQEEVSQLIEERLVELQQAQVEQGGVIFSELKMENSDGVYSLEIEIPRGPVAIAYPVSFADRQAVAEYLTHQLAEKGINVFKDEK